jgi:hypothetical protein
MCNPAFEKMCGFASSEIIGRSPWFLAGKGTDEPASRPCGKPSRSGASATSSAGCSARTAPHSGPTSLSRSSGIQPGRRLTRFCASPMSPPADLRGPRTRTSSVPAPSLGRRRTG